MTSVALGVDGGNTKTLAIVTDLDGRVLGTGRSGSGDIYDTTPEAALAELDRAIGGALGAAGVHRDEVEAAGFSLAGADWPEDFAFLGAQLRTRLGDTARIVVVNDAIGALVAGTPEGDGVAVVCGTGSAIGARSGGSTWHASFWGEDNGALAFGHGAMRAMVRADLGLGPEPAFTKGVLDALAVPSVEALLHRATRRGKERTMLAVLAPLVLDAAQAGDATACRIVSEAGQGLGDYAGVAARKVGLVDRPFPLVLAGGVFRHPSDLLRTEILTRQPDAIAIDPEFEPVVGALKLAVDLIGRRVSIPALRESLPADDAFVRPGAAARTQVAPQLDGRDR